MSSEKTVTISKSIYDELVLRGFKLQCLENHGVDNWCGYDDAMQEYRGEEDEDESYEDIYGEPDPKELNEDSRD